jgi:hypothetical protein
MSAIAMFIRVPKTALEGLRLAATPEKRTLWKGARDGYWDYLQRNGQSVAEYEWSGDVFSTLLPYLEERHQIDLTHSGFEELATFLSRTRGADHLILTDELRNTYLAALANPFSEEELRDYYNEFTGTADEEAAKPMLDGIRCLRDSLMAVDDASVVVFIIS